MGFIGFGAPSVALLAVLPEALAEEILWENEWLLGQAAIERDKLLLLIDQARHDGYCYSERVFVRDLCAISLCVPASSGLPYAAISVLTQTEQIPPSERKAILAQMRRETTLIARQVERRNSRAP